MPHTKNSIDLRHVMVFSQEGGHHVSANDATGGVIGGLLLATYSGYRDTRLTDEQVKVIIDSICPFGMRG